MKQERLFAANEVLAGLSLAALAFVWLLAFNQLAPESLAWTLTRVSGVLGYSFLALSVALGALTASKYIPQWLSKALQYGWHGLLSGFSLALVGVHVAYTLVDTQYPQTLLGVLLPGLATYAPLALALGTLATYGMVTVYISFASKNKLPRRVWRTLHLLAYPSFILATLHGLWAGSDNLGLLYTGAAGMVIVTFLLRIFEVRSARQVKA